MLANLKVGPFEMRKRNHIEVSIATRVSCLGERIIKRRRSNFKLDFINRTFIFLFISLHYIPSNFVIFSYDRENSEVRL